MTQHVGCRASQGGARRTTARNLLLGTAVAAAGLLGACGGGGGGPDPVVTTPPPPPPPVSRFEPGVFAPSSDFAGLCNAEDEKFFLRSFTHETYLWYDEVEDRDPTVASESVGAYFDQLRTFRETPNGTPVDNFHFTLPTEEYERSNSGQVFGYGVEFALLRSAPETLADGTTVGRLLRAAFVLDGEAADQGGMARGATILSIDGVDVAFGEDTATLNDGLFPDTIGEQHTFEFTLNGSDEVLTATLTADQIAEQPVQGYGTFDEGGDTAAYIHFTTFSPDTAEAALFDAFTDLSDEGIDNLYLDLRYNGGGKVAIACQLGYMVAGDANTAGRTCSQLVSNDKLDNGDPFPFLDEGEGFSVSRGTPLPTLDLDKVTVLSTGGTCSASELVLNALNGIDLDVSLVGARTCGKPYGFVPESNCGTTYFTIQFQSVNNKGFGEYADGLIPTEGTVSNQAEIKGCVVEDDFDAALGSTTEALLATAIDFNADGTCAAATSTSQDQAAVGKTSVPGSLREASFGIIDDRPGALGQTPRIQLHRLREAGLLLDGE